MDSGHESNTAAGKYIFVKQRIGLSLGVLTGNKYVIALEYRLVPAHRKNPFYYTLSSSSFRVLFIKETQDLIFSF